MCQEFRYGHCCMVVLESGLFDWYGHRVATSSLGGANVVGGNDFPEELNAEGACLWRTPTLWPNNEHEWTGDFRYYTSQDEGWAIRYSTSAGDDYVGVLNLTLAPAAATNETVFTRRSSVRTIEYTNRALALASWTAGAGAVYTGGRLEFDGSGSATLTSAYTSVSGDEYRVQIEAEAAEVTWIKVTLDTGISTETDWIDLSHAEIYDDRDWERAGENTYHYHFTASASGSQSIIIQLVDGDGSSTYSGSSGDGIVLTRAEVNHVSDYTDPSETEVAQFDCDAGTLDWRQIIPHTAIVNTATYAQYTGTYAADEWDDQVSSASLRGARKTSGWQNVGDDLIFSRLSNTGPGLGFGHFYPGFAACGTSSIGFGTSSYGLSVGEAIIITVDSGGYDFDYCVGEDEWGHIRAQEYTYDATPGTRPSVSGNRYYDDVRSYDAVPDLPSIFVFPPRDFPNCLSFITAWPKSRAEASYNGPTGGTFYVTESVSNYIAITYGPYSATEYGNWDGSTATAAANPDWLQSTAAPTGHSTGKFDFFEGAGRGSAIWSKTSTQTRVFAHTVQADAPLPATPLNNSAKTTQAHLGINPIWGDAGGGDGAAIFTHCEATISISGSSGLNPASPATETVTGVEAWIVVAGAGATREEQVWRDGDRNWFRGLAYVKGGGFTYFEKIFSTAPSSGSAGTQSYWRMHAPNWTLDSFGYLGTDGTTGGPDCVASSDRWMYVNEFPYASLEVCWDIEPGVTIEATTGFTHDDVGVGGDILGGFGGGIAVTVWITHPNVQDLELYLIAPDATVINLAIQKGGDADGFTATRFTPLGSTTLPASNSGAPFTGNYLPDEDFLPSLSAYTSHANGTSASGGWTLRVKNISATPQAGTLDRWRLELGDKKSQWAFSHAAGDDGPEYGHWPRYDYEEDITVVVPEGGEFFHAWPGGDGATYIDCVKNSAMLVLTPEETEY